MTYMGDTDTTFIFQPIWLNAISEVTQPNQTIAIAKYDWNHWLPLLGPDRWCLVHKLRAMYIFQRNDTEPGRRVTIQTDLTTLADQLGLPYSRVKTILSSDPIPGKERWRRLKVTKPGKRNPQEATHAYHWRFFIPRLRYHYIPQEGRPPKPAGLVIELVLDLLPTQGSHPPVWAGGRALGCCVHVPRLPGRRASVRPPAPR